MRIVLKCDVENSLEFLRGRIETDGVVLVDASVGEITASDVELVDAGDAVIGFGVVATEAALVAAATNGVHVRTYRNIYEMLDDLRNMIVR